MRAEIRGWAKPPLLFGRASARWPCGKLQAKRAQDAGHGSEFRIAGFAEGLVEALAIEARGVGDAAHAAGARDNAHRIANEIGVQHGELSATIINVLVLHFRAAAGGASPLLPLRH